MNDFKEANKIWEVDGFDLTSVIEQVNEIGWKHIATCNYGHANPEIHFEENKKNAKLMSCAPEMLEMLKEAKAQINYLQEKFKETGSGNAVLSRIDSLIEKATK